ncbi:995_t:CDS:2, partial [Racocetra fulgida]
DEDLDNIMLEPKDSDQYEPNYIDPYEPNDIDLYEPENSDLDELENSDLDEPENSDLDEPENSDLDEPEGIDLDRICSRIKYVKDGSTSNLWRHLRNKHHISRAMVEGGRVKIVVKSNNIAFIVEELQPFSIIQLRSFKRIIEGLDTQANVLSNDHLKEILINSEDKILQDLCEYALDSAEISYVSFTTNMWTSNNGNPYIGLTLHWINDSFQVKEITGNISYLPYPYTSECLLNKIVEILDNLRLKHLTISSTVDNGSNIKLCLEKLDQKYGIFRIHCFEHTLQHAIIEINDNSSLRSYEKKELSSDEWEKINELVKLLYPYEVISKKLSGLQYPTLSQAWFAINFIKVKLNCTIVSNADIKRFGEHLYESLQE